MQHLLCPASACLGSQFENGAIVVRAAKKSRPVKIAGGIGDHGGLGVGAVCAVVFEDVQQGFGLREGERGSSNHGQGNSGHERG